MNYRLPYLSLLAFALIGAPIVHAHPTAIEMADSSKKFLASLSPDQKDKAKFEWSSEERLNWHFIPRDRKGLPIKDLKPEQTLLAQSLLVSGLSHRGYHQALEIMSLEQILFEMENQSPKRDPINYYFSFFGEPDPEGTWGWRFEGHHLSLNYTVIKGKEISVTPSFFGTNPGEVMEGPRKGLRVLGEEEDMGRSLLKSFTDEQKKIAILSTEAPADVIAVPGRETKGEIEPKGLFYADMSDSQKKAVKDLIQQYLNKHREPVVKETLKRIDAAGWNAINFAWAGGTERHEPHYYRLQGPTFLFEYDNTQNGANHVHLVWRDYTRDFGEDLLKKHYNESH